MAIADRAERLGDHRSVPAPRGPAAIGLEVERQHRVAGRAGQPDGARLRGSRRTARAVDGERRDAAGRELAAQLHERARAAARRRSPGGAKPEPRHQPGNPFAVEVLAGHRDDAAIAPVERRGQDPAMPEREDRRPARPHQLVVVLRALDPPAQRPAERSRPADMRPRQSRRPSRVAWRSGTRHAATCPRTAALRRLPAAPSR